MNSSPPSTAFFALVLILARRICCEASQLPSAGAFICLCTIAFPFALPASAAAPSGPLSLLYCLTLLMLLHPFMYNDHRDRIIIWLRASGMPIATIVFIKCFTHFLFIQLPLIAILLLLSFLFPIANDIRLSLLLAFIFAAPALSVLSVTLGSLFCLLPQAALLASLCSLPFFLPFLIFIQASAVPFSLPLPTGLLWLGALSAIVCALLPFVAQAALRESL